VPLQDCAEGRFTPMLLAHIREAGFNAHEVRTVQAVDAYAAKVAEGRPDVGLIVSCGSPVVLTEPLDIGLHVTKTTAAMLHFPNAPVVGICFGMQLLALLYGGSLVAQPDVVRGQSGERAAFCYLRRTDAPSRLLGGIAGPFLQWCSNYIFLDHIPAHFAVTSVDNEGRAYAMEHLQEHVYGVLFHPEMLGEGVRRDVIDSILALVGQNRRIPQHRRRMCIGSGASWQCSAQCRLRRAVRDAALGNGGFDGGSVNSRGCRGSRSGGDLPERLASAKREALAILQRDHCSNGGITVAALEDAIHSLGELADAADFSEGHSRCGCSREAAVEEGDLVAAASDSSSRQARREARHTCSPHDADLRLRDAVKRVLRKSRSAVDAKGPTSGVVGSSRATSAGSARTSTSCPTSCSESSRPRIASCDGVLQPTASQAAKTHLQQTGGQVAGGCSDIASGEPCLNVHEADLRLRRAVQEALRTRTGDAALAKTLAALRRDALTELKRVRRNGGGVPAELLEKLEAGLQTAGGM